jgi:hypothetical protein
VLLLFCAILFLSVPLAAVVGRLVDRFRRTDRGPAPAPSRIARLLLALIAALNLLGLADLLLVFDNAYLAVARGDVSSLYLPLLLWLSAAVLTMGALGFTALAWKNRYWGVMGRVHYALVTLAAVVFIWSLNFWNLLGWRM